MSFAPTTSPAADMPTARELLEQDFGVAADVWSCPSFTELGRDGTAVARWNMLHPTEEPRRSYVEACLAGQSGPAAVPRRVWGGGSADVADDKYPQRRPDPGRSEQAGAAAAC